MGRLTSQYGMREGRLECDVDTGARSDSGMHNKVLGAFIIYLAFCIREAFALFFFSIKKKKCAFCMSKTFLHKLADETGVVPVQPN